MDSDRFYKVRLVMHQKFSTMNTQSTTIKSTVFRVLVVGIISLVLAACATQSGNDETLASLQTIEIDTTPQAMPPQKKIDTKKRYSEVLKSTKNQELRARALERLADLQLEGHQENQANKEEQQVAQFGPGSKGKATASATAAAAAVIEDDTDYGKVAEQYESILKRKPYSKENERILYQLGRAYDLDGQLEKSVAVLTRLIREFPKTESIIEIQFRRGEILFSLKRFEEAEKAYNFIVKDEESNFYERALYKLGWSIFKQNKLQQALVAFYNLLDYYYESKATYDRFTRTEKEIVDDVFRAISLSYSLQDGANTIYDFTKKYGNRIYVSQIYENLAQLYLKQERFEDTANVYQAYVQFFPGSRESPGFMVKIIDIYKKGGFPTALTKAKEDFIEIYGVGKKYWKRQDRQLFAEMRPHLKSNIDDLAKHYHAKGQKSKSKKDYKKAAYWYRQYVDSFPADKKAAQMHFQLADSLIDSKKYGEAAIEYEQTAYRYPMNPRSAEAAYAAILAHQRVLDEFKKNPKNAKNIEQATNSKRKAIINASLRFADHFPKDKRVPLVTIKSAEELLDMKLYTDASGAAQRITKMKSKAAKKLQPQAWAIIATSEFELGNHKAAELASIQRLRLTAKDDKTRKALITRLAASIYKQGEAAREAGNLEEAADHFLRIASLAPTSAVRTAAQYDAAAAYIQLEAWGRSIKVLNSFVKSNPQHKLTPSAYENLALAYEKSEKWAEAASIYEKIYAQETDVERKRNILWLSAELFDKSGKKADSIEVYKKYVKDFNQPVEQSVEARQKIADYYLAKKQIQKRHYWLGEIIKADSGKGSSDRTHFLAATAALELAEPKYKAYLKVKLKQPLKKNLKKKKALLQETIDAYTAAADYGIAAITTASTYRIANVYQDFSIGLFDSERPKNLSPDELEQYDILLEEQAYPFEEKAIEIHEANANRVTGGIYDEWVKKSFKALRELNPVRYAKNERSELFNSVLN